MVAVDTNVLVYASRADTAHHAAASRLLRELSEGDAPWSIPWPCAYELIRVLTHPRVFAPPTPLEEAVEQLEAILDSPTLVMLGQGPSHRGHIRRLLLAGMATGNRAHDAHVAALVLEHGIDELLSADRDLARFPGVRVRNPFQKRL